MQPPTSLTRDPVFYVTLLFFTLITTALPTILEQPRFLPFVQTICLTAFMAVALRRRQLREGIIIVALWVVVQLVLMALLTWLAQGRVENAIPDGFQRRTAFLEWYFADAELFDGLLARPPIYIIQIIAVVLGSLVSGGLLGVWVLVRTVNVAGYYVGALLLSSGNSMALIAGLPLWTALRIASYVGLVVLFAQPLLANSWSLWTYFRTHRQFLLLSIALLTAALLFEIMLPDLWRSLFVLV